MANDMMSSAVSSTDRVPRRRTADRREGHSPTSAVVSLAAHPCRFMPLATRRPGGRRSLLLGRLDASPEGGHEVYGPGGRWRRLEKLLSLQLGLDDLHQRL